jgi:hypothetical protein
VNESESVYQLIYGYEDDYDDDDDDDKNNITLVYILCLFSDLHLNTNISARLFFPFFFSK